MGSVVLCCCDNEGVVAAVKGGCCKDPALAHIFQCLFLEAMFNLLLTARYVPGVENGVVDTLSRNKLHF